MGGDAVDLQQFVGRTFERDGCRCYVQFVRNKVEEVDVDWRSATTDYTWSSGVPVQILSAWLAGAVEVKGEA